MTGERMYVGRRRTMTIEDWRALGWSQTEAERYTRSDCTTTEVVVVDPAGVRPLKHFQKHSPGGFEWGYGGSGCAELARCMLLDHYQLQPPDDPWLADGLQVSYQAFKRDVVARLPRDTPWSVTSSEIERWAIAKARRGEL
jgi:Family of unknown function (DUF6166)